MKAYGIIINVIIGWSIFMLALSTADLVSTSWWIKGPYLAGMGILVSKITK